MNTRIGVWQVNPSAPMLSRKHILFPTQWSIARKIVMLFFLALSLALEWGWTQTQDQAVVSRVHWITIHTRTAQAFEAVCELFGEEMQLPVFFGPETHGTRRYQALLAASVILEVCGPFPDSPYRATNVLARFNTLSFRAATTAAASSAELSVRTLAHEPPRAESWDKAQLQVNVTALSVAGMPVSITERVDGADSFNDQLKALHDKFREGGPLGIRALDEVRISYSDQKRLAQWRTFLFPNRSTDGRWELSEKPALRFVRSDRDEIVAVVFTVESLPSVKLHLEQRGLLGKARGNEVEVAPHITGGLQIILRQ